MLLCNQSDIETAVVVFIQLGNVYLYTEGVTLLLGCDYFCVSSAALLLGLLRIAVLVKAVYVVVENKVVVVVVHRLAHLVAVEIERLALCLGLVGFVRLCPSLHNALGGHETFCIAEWILCLLKLPTDFCDCSRLLIVKEAVVVIVNC